MTDLFIQMRTLNKRLKCNMVLKRNRSIPLKLALRCSCIHGKQSKVAHGQPAGNYSTSHHIPEHTWRPRTPRYEFSVQANEVVAISPSFFLSSPLFFTCSHHSLRRCAVAEKIQRTLLQQVSSFFRDQDDGCGLYCCKHGVRARFFIPNASTSSVCSYVSLKVRRRK